MFALGLLGSVGAAILLAPLIITWRSELKHQRVTWGLDCLKAMETDTALMQLNGIAQKTRHPNLRERALENLAAVAKQHKITQEQLEDRIVSDCGLDARGKKTFDYGSRQFEFIVGADMQPLVRDEKSKLLTNLPKPNKKDDSELANQSIANWKLLKKQIIQVVKIQTARLEQAMITERHWSKEEFELWLVNHPLMTHLTQRLVWAGYDAQNQLITTFRVAEDHTYTNINDKSLNLDGITTIGLIHPLYLTSEVRDNWRQLWSDYELITPFPQLDREIFLPTPTEQYQTIVTRFTADCGFMRYSSNNL